MTQELRTHFTWSIECPRGECPVCGGKTVLVSKGSGWDADEEHVEEVFGEGVFDKEFIDGVSVDDEISAHFCRECRRLTSLSLNWSPIGVEQ